MSRGLSSGMQAAVAASTVYPALFVECDFSTGNVYVWSGQGSISWNGQTWTGLGDLISVDKISEDSQVAARGIKLTLSGVPAATIYNALVADYRGRSCKIWLGCFDSAGSLISSPQQIFGGRMDQMTIQDGADKCIVEMTIESRLVDLQRQRERRFTDADQQYFYPGDTFLQYVSGLQDQTIYWGQATPTAAPAAAVANAGAPMSHQQYRI